MGKIKKKRTKASPDTPCHQKKNTCDESNFAMMFSMYSLTCQNFNSTLNSFTSVILVTISAFAFMIATIKPVGFEKHFNIFISLFIAFFISYMFSLFFCFKAKKVMFKNINTDKSGYDFKSINQVNSLYNLSFYSILLFSLLSLCLVVFYSEIIIFRIT